MRLLNALLLLFLIPVSTACIVELRSTTFYVNGTQEVTRDWFVVDFENSYGYTLFDVHFGDLAYVSVIREGERVRIDPYKSVAPSTFPITIYATVESFADRSVVRYTLQNFGENVEISISIPLFPDFISCDNCVVSEGYIVFSETIAKNETKSFNLTLRRDFTIPDGNVSFRYHGKIDMNFTANIPVTVEKGRSEKWIGVFNVSNVLDKKIKGNVTAYAEIDGSREELFNETIELNPGEIFKRVVEVESTSVPIFYFKVQLRVEDYCNLTIIPATEFGGRYVVGYATLKGFVHKATVAPGFGRTIPEIVTLPTPEIPRTQFPTPELPREERIEAVPELKIPPPRIAKEVVVHYVVTIPTLFGTFFVTVLFPVLSKRGFVVLREHENLVRSLYPKFRIYTAPSSPSRFGIVIEPDEELVSRLMEIGLDRKNAELLAVAVKVKRPAIVDKSVARVALSLGIMVIPYGRP